MTTTKNLNDTIVACATPAGYSSIGVVRISGSQAISFTKKIFFSKPIEDHIENHRAYYGDIIQPDTREVIDKAVAVFHLAPHSYTGEDVVEISCHGNPLIIERVVRLFTELGARVAERGEFTKRALLNGKIDLLQAESVLDTVYSPCDEARKLAIAQYEGKLSKKVYELKSKIIDLLVLVEADIDFGEEEELTEDRTSINNTLEAIIQEIDLLLDGAELGMKIKEGYKVLIMGRANVGKSTLFNRLVGYDRAIIHKEPGTTRDYLEEGIELAGLYLRLYDTAGMLANKCDEPDRIAQERTMELIEQSDLILLMFDGSEPMNEQDVFLYDLTKSKNKLLLVNKIDLNIRLTESEILSDSVKLSAKTGENIDILKQKIKDKLLPKFSSENLLLTRQRHIQCMKKIRDYLKKAVTADFSETVAFELNAALDCIGELTGKIMHKEVLDRIFEEFCIGK